ncbi:MAG: phytanoyl-CoA dioxygenase family protein [Nakamurella sp.]
MVCNGTLVLTEYTKDNGALSVVPGSHLFELLFVPSILISILPGSWQTLVKPYLPMNSGEQIYIAVHHEPNTLVLWTGLGVFSLYAAVALAVALALITRRDT